MQENVSAAGAVPRGAAGRAYRTPSDLAGEDGGATPPQAFHRLSAFHFPAFGFGFSDPPQGRGQDITFGGLEPRSSRARERKPILGSGGRAPMGVQGAQPPMGVRG